MILSDGNQHLIHPSYFKRTQNCIYPYPTRYENASPGHIAFALQNIFALDLKIVNLWISSTETKNALNDHLAKTLCWTH